jgi:hypothetical protein
MTDLATKVPIVIYHGETPVIKIEPDANDDGLIVKSVAGFQSIASTETSPLRRKVSNAKTALVFALYWLSQNSNVPAEDFAVVTED